MARRPKVWLLLALAAVAAVVLVVWVIPSLLSRTIGDAPPTLDALVSAASSQTTRSFQGRLSVPIAYRPLDRDVNEQTTATPARIEARRIIQRSSAATAHSVGIAKLITGDLDGAIAAFQNARAQPTAHTAPINNDLAAVLLARASQTQDAGRFAQAREMAKASIEADREFAPAYFNLALAYEGLGAPALARRAWEEFLKRDGTSAWADEARTHQAQPPPARSRPIVFQSIEGLKSLQDFVILSPANTSDRPSVRTAAADFAASFYVDVGEFCTAAPGLTSRPGL